MKILCTDYPKAFIYTRMYPIPDTYIKQDNLERKKMYPTTLLTFLITLVIIGRIIASNIRL